MSLPCLLEKSKDVGPHLDYKYLQQNQTYSKRYSSRYYPLVLNKLNLLLHNNNNSDNDRQSATLNPLFTFFLCGNILPLKIQIHEPILVLSQMNQSKLKTPNPFIILK